VSPARNVERWRAAALLVGAALGIGWGLGAGCAEHVEAGLANAQSIETPTVPVRHHDVIANGDDSCPRATGVDPLPGRTPPCKETFTDAGLLGDGGPGELPTSAH
jgi:hypothetical protein